jgi:pyruvate/2-oxoglutarate dehydrogenase complex dihydrolipoamide acyltransferase (E2) component
MWGTRQSSPDTQSIDLETSTFTDFPLVLTPLGYLPNTMGTALITSVGTAGHLSKWVIPKAMHNLCFALGPILKKPWVVANRIEIRDILHLTVLIDHDVVDGAPAARLVARLLGRIQKGM